MFTVNNVEILAQSSADCVLTYNFQGTHVGTSRGHLCDSSVFFLFQLLFIHQTMHLTWQILWLLISIITWEAN